MTALMTTAREPSAQALHELNNILAVTLARAEALLAEGAGADVATRTDALESIRRAMLRAREALGRLQRLTAGGGTAADSGRPRVLLVDDDPLMLETLRGLLEPAGYDVETAASGEDGIERYRRERFDCVVTDARMRGVSGLIVCRAIKDHDPDAHVVLLTGVEHDPEELRAAGVDRVLLKPTRRATILDAVRRTRP
jgi:CheY-like chemotaxis protein